ncbi:MAG: hypothetical protein ACR2PZ_26910 [Pseudomonadales bacterium]
MVDDRELAAYRDAYGHILKNNAEQGPSDDELAALVTGELDDDARDRIARQMLSSQQAIEKHKILQELHQQAAKRRPLPQKWPRVAGIAATLVVAFSVWQFLPPESQVTTQRGDKLESIGQTASSPSGNVALEAAPTAYQWRAEPGAHRYRVQVFDAAAQQLWQSDWTTGTQLPAPTDGELSFPYDKRYFWVVEIDGSAARRSLGPYWFRIEQ